MFDKKCGDWIIEIYSAHTHFDEALLHAGVERLQDYAVIKPNHPDRICYH